MNDRPLKLLIVEDEENTRQLIKIIPDWESLGVQIIGEASTGVEALYMMEEQLPDIVLTDIEMPYMDGLTLSRRIMERYSDVSVIILTAHDHFAYAQQALGSGVSGYVLKPIGKAPLERAVGEAAERVRDRRALLGRMETSYKYVRNHQSFFRDKLLLELMRKGAVDGLEEILEIVGVRFGPEHCYTLALLHITGGNMVSFTAQKYIILNNCRAYIEENYCSGRELYVFDDGFDNLALLSHEPDTDLSDICRQITEAISGNLDCVLRCGISDPCSSAAALPNAYAQAREALQLAIMSEDDGPRGAVLSDRFDMEEQLSNLLLYVKSGMEDKAVPLAAALMNYAGAQHEGDLDAAKMFAVGFLARATDTLSNLGIPWLTLVTLVTPWYARILEKTTFSGAEALISDQTASLCTLAGTYQQQKSGEMIANVLRDVEENYGDAELSLSLLAKKHAVNSSYLSRAFKNYTRKSFSDYLVEMRIGKARDILEKSDYKAYQLAQMVGIHDPNYFAKCFKKVTGLSFQAYKAERTARDLKG